MKKILHRSLKLLIFISLLILVACAPSQAQLQAAVATAIASMPTATAYPTLTPYPTFTTAPSQTPHIIVVTKVPSPTPVFAIWTANQVVDAFRSVGLELENPTDMVKDDYGLAPMAALNGIHFFIPSLCADCGGRIFEFNNVDGLAITKTYYESLGVQSAAFFSWVFVKNNILIQINGDLPEELARKYEQALDSIGK